MSDEASQPPQSVRNYERRLYRHRQLYWRALLPVLILLIGGFMLGHFLEALLLAVLGVMIVLLLMLREIIDVLGYLGSLQREAALAREAVRKELAALNARPPSS
ncbi:MAG: hypothetical protein ABR553_05320 [Gammaproteobacteria bacterium]